jgi:hypothetical protein
LYGTDNFYPYWLQDKQQPIEPVPKPYGFSTGSWKKRSKARFFPLNPRLLFQKLKFWNNLNFEKFFTRLR